MDERSAKELLFLENLLDNQIDGKNGRFYYSDFLERGNYKIRRGTYSESLRENVLMPDNPEHSELDWWIMIALNDLKAGDFESIYTYLSVEKALHPELLFNADARLIKRRLNFLTRVGYILQVCYVVNTDVDASAADELWKKYLRQKEDELLRNKAAKDAADFSDLLQDEEDSISDLKYSYFDKSEYGKEIQASQERSLIRALGSMGEDQNIKAFYGKNASVVRLFMLEIPTTWALETRYGPGNVSARFFGNPIHRFICKNIALAAVGKVASCLAKEKSFIRFGNCMMRSKLNGAFTLPCQMEFKVKAKDGNYLYNCALFHAYFYQVEGKEPESFARQRIVQSVYEIKNFIGQRGNIHGAAKKSDAFAIVVVNDALDLMKFMEVFKQKASPAEFNRIFFTGEGVIESEFGVKRMIGIEQDQKSECGFVLYPASLPVVG